MMRKISTLAVLVFSALPLACSAPHSSISKNQLQPPAPNAAQASQSSQAATGATGPTAPTGTATTGPGDTTAMGDINVPILRFAQVAPGVYRGARPETDGMKALAELNVKTDLDLENNDDAIDAERKDAAELKINFISKPLSGFWSPDDNEVNEIISIISDKNNYPIFIHCEHGQDRTGMVVGLFRVQDQDWTPDAAYDEALDKGFHEILFPLAHYFREKTETIYGLRHPSAN